MLVKSLMLKPVKNMLVAPSTRLQNIIDCDAMIQGGCVIVCEGRHLSGILTDGDLRRHLKNYSQNSKVEEIMTASPQSIQENALVSDAFRLMTELKINQLPVVDEQLQVLGYLDYHSVANEMSPEQLFIDLNETQLTENENRHLARYHFAAQFIEPDKKVLDCACGSGYGSKLLADNRLKVTSVDLCDKAIRHARDKYRSDNIDFICRDISQIDFAANSFDAVVSLETLEHVPNDVCRQYLSNIDKFLKPGGMVVASSPMLRYRNGQPYITNPYHINEQPKAELLAMFKTLLPDYVLHFYHQKETKFVPLTDEDTGFCILVARKPN
ncbi:methyltransferase domain-containing protein [Psychromonas aquimarina]|uniref:methyltransferase domain-containing protein n=1 Tax=Psychromonas aquimarina TaxID=444919 RepID=UPI0003F799B7|nr:methyltransferase domain-containing protein [Psychromonas aquimarina]